jgi:TPP-dependent trihydroxycyclohexane-1,2-dione (THcHDO) dehydratase
MGCFHYLRTGELCEFYKAEDLKRFPTVSEQGIMTTILDYSKKSAETSGVAISNASGTGAVPTMVGSSSTARFNVTTNLSAISSTVGSSHKRRRVLRRTWNHTR